MLLARLIERLVTGGHLIIIDADGAMHRFGDATASASTAEDAVVIRLHDRKLHSQLFFNPRMKLGEAYMDGSLTVERGTIYDFLDLVGRGLGTRIPSFLGDMTVQVERLVRFTLQHNPLGKAQQNVAHHYDLSRQLYELFLDSDLQYSCAYFPRPGMTIDEAQQAKKRHIAAKLLLEPGQSVLDIGCGWGGMAMYLADVADVQVTGVTLSKEQHDLAAERARRQGLARSVSFRLQDYRQESASYDRVVSVGMFEHVGTPHYSEFFEKIRDLLTDDGVALIHSIGRMDGPGSTNPWLRKYIFPGGYSPALSEVLPVVERAGLWVTDIEILRLHYAETLRLWRERLLANRDRVTELYDDRFCRMWEFYLAGCEIAFRHGGHMVFQLQVAKSQSAVPLTRDYITDWERQQKATGTESRLRRRTAAE